MKPTNQNELRLIYSFAHLPEKLRFLANPPPDITLDKYNDVKYLKRCVEMIEELDEQDFKIRKDGVSPYSKKILIQHFNANIQDLE